MRQTKCFHSYVIYTLAGVLMAGVSAYPLYAQDAAANAPQVQVRASVQDGFIRFVFSGQNMPTARKAQEVGRSALSVQFNMAARVETPDVAGITPKPSVRVDGQLVKMDVPTLERVRHVRVGNRLVLDVFTKEKPAFVKVEEVAKAAPIAEAVTKPNEAEAKAQTADEPIRDLAKETPVDEKMGAQPQIAGQGGVGSVTPLKEVAKADIYKGNAVITFGSTQGLMMAAFMRGDKLWVVTSGDQAALPAQIGGANKDDVKLVFTREIDGGRVYQFALPKGAQVMPEGGGLIWRLHVKGEVEASGGVYGTPDLSDSQTGARLKLPLLGAGSVLRVDDAQSGLDMAAVLVNKAGAYVGVADQYVDFGFVPAIVGAFIVPKVDGFNVSVGKDEVFLGRTQGGLRLSSVGVRRQDTVLASDGTTSVAPVNQDNGNGANGAINRVYDFENWAMGGEAQFFTMRRAIDSRIAIAQDDFKLPEIVNGAKFMLAHGLPHEALGYMQMAYGLMPLLRESADFQAMAGAIYALLGHNAQALEAFKNPGLAHSQEIDLWRAYALSNDNQFDKAQESLPRAAVLPILESYPARVQALLLPVVLDGVLARGDVRLAERLVALYDENVSKRIADDRDLVVDYYKGRVAVLLGDMEKSNALLSKVSFGGQGLYPLRATLALIERDDDLGELNRDKALQALERFRYGWRGDAYEREVLRTLGLLYIKNNEQRRGLGVLRTAASLASQAKDRDALVEIMRKAFRDLFVNSKEGAMKPLDAAAVANEFGELMPTGAEGEEITVGIAQSMAELDLLARAAALVEPLVVSTEKAENALKYAERAASYRLLERTPKAALEVIEKALGRADVKGMDEAALRGLKLLGAQAKADMNRVNDAVADINALQVGDDSLRLLADISWKAKRWPLAAETFGRLIAHANLDATTPPSMEEAQLVLNRALALNLAGDTAALETLNIGYNDIMRRTQLYRPFLVVTRNAREAQLADRETLLSLVSEVNLFKDVLESYKNNKLAPNGADSGQVN